jgi:hypothetical protein
LAYPPIPWTKQNESHTFVMKNPYRSILIKK